MNTFLAQATRKESVESSGTASAESIQLLCPIYNEGDNVISLYRTLREEGVPFDSLTFVYDFDGDNTLPFIAKLKAEDDRVRAEKQNYGKGVINALRWGFHHVGPGPVIVLMGDNSDKLSVVPRMLELWQGGATVVSASRYMKGGKQHGGGLLKSTMSRTAGLSLKICGFPTSDPTNNFKLYDGTWLKQQQVESVGGFEVALELCYKAYRDGRKIVETPTEWFDRTQGESRFQMRKWIPKYLAWYFRTLGVLLFGNRRKTSASSATRG